MLKFKTKMLSQNGMVEQMMCKKITKLLGFDKLGTSGSGQLSEVILDNTLEVRLLTSEI